MHSAEHGGHLGQRPGEGGDHPGATIHHLFGNGPITGQKNGNIETPFHTISAPPQPLSLSASKINIHGIRHLLGIEASDMRTIVTHIRAHIIHNHFPAPISSRLVGGKPVPRGPDNVCAKALWNRDEVDIYFDAPPPGSTHAHPASPAPLTPAVRDQLAEDLTRRAAMMCSQGKQRRAGA